MLIWGCCWFNEDVDCVIQFINNSLESLNKYNFDTIPVVFVANTGISEDDINYLKENVKGVVILRNNYDLYPNKNYGVYSIVSYSYAKKSDYVAIVDPDWNIVDFDNYMETVLKSLIDKECDIIIPNIGNASGRSNILVGKSALELFYKDYSNDIKSAFPGSVFGLTNSLYKIVSSNDYHFDWGGEWDLLSYAIKNNYRVLSKDVNVINVRHRNNKSKINDSFQIWRAVFSNSDIKSRYIKSIPNSYNHRLLPLLNNFSSIDGIISVLEKQELSKTERQLLYMVLYPIKSIIDGKEYKFIINEESNEPYDKKEIFDVFELGLYCLNTILNKNIINRMIDNTKRISDGFFGPWTQDNKQIVVQDMQEQIKRYI